MVYIFFFYGLAFFSMGLIVLVEGGKGSDERLKHALRPLVGFGLVHGIHEWVEMFVLLDRLIIPEDAVIFWEAGRVFSLAISFISLTAFGAFLLSTSAQTRRLSFFFPLTQVAVWGIGLLLMNERYQEGMRIWAVADVWSRYILGIPAGLFACVGLIVQQRAFRLAGMAEYGRDSLWAGITFAWYGVVGQMFPRPSLLWPSTFLNQELFFYWFGFPVQLLRMAAAIMVAVFVIRFLRSFEVEKQRQIAVLQTERFKEARKRETLRVELFQRVVAAQEAERKRIARELHDETGQALTALGMGLRGVSSQLKSSNLSSASHNLRELEKLTSHSLDELQRLISDLRPSHLDDLGLPSALRWYANETMGRVPFTIRVEISGVEISLEPQVKLTLFRIVQEALNNVAKHANAEDVLVCLAYQESAVRIQIHDNGHGFSEDELRQNELPSWGLMGMRERAALLGGECRIVSDQNMGTLIQVTVPLKIQELLDEKNTSVVSG